jgi:dolichol-phosphate mannosyltransferase
MVKLNELNSSFTSQMFWLGFDRKFIEFERKKREFGKSGWTINKKIKLFFDSIFGFTQLPILIMTYLSLSLILFSLIFLLLSIYIKIKGIYTIPGYLTTASLIVLGNGVTYLFLSIIGGYVYRNFQNGTGRSSFIISRTYSKSQIEL